MKFTTTSTDFLQALLSVAKVVPQKAVIKILECFLLELKGNTLTVTGSDQDTTLKSIVSIDNVTEEGRITVPAILLTNAFKELPDQPIDFATCQEENKKIITIKWANGLANIPYTEPDEYPELPSLVEAKELKMSAEVLLAGLNDTVYAAGDDQIRVVMNGVYFDISQGSATLVASNAQKLVYYKRSDISAEEGSFVLSKKPAAILKSMLARYTDEPVTISYDNKNISFLFDRQLLICRATEGTYPAYKSVIPTNNPNVVTVARVDILNAVKRVAVCANQATGQLALHIKKDSIDIVAQDLDLSMNANEVVPCSYDGDEMSIGLKAQFLIEILSNLPYEQICLKLADPSKAVLIQTAEEAKPNEEICALLMPLRIN